MSPLWIVAGATSAFAVMASVIAFRCHRTARDLRRKFAPVLNVEEEATRLRRDAHAGQQAAERELNGVRTQIEELRRTYSVGHARYEELSRELASLEENLQSVNVGLYNPHFTYEDSESYKAAILRCRDNQKALIKAGQAVVCHISWEVGGSKREGARMVKQTEGLVLRAFNAESEAAVANVTWNNYRVMEARINKTHDALNKLGTVLRVSLTEKYRQTRLEELKLVYESAEKRQQEREEQRRQREEQREQEKVQRELEREQESATKDEATFHKALMKAQEQLETAAEGERSLMHDRIQKLEKELAQARERKERAIAQAQLTRAGHVYIISNLGAFGEGVIKIGLTRRLEPDERVRELGDASVPFPFDTHALIYSEDAPSLEKKLHDHFWDRRLNWANSRKEFFRVELTELESQLRELGLAAELRQIAEAKEYRQTLAAKLTQHDNVATPLAATISRFPADPFSSSPPMPALDRPTQVA